MKGTEAADDFLAKDGVSRFVITQVFSTAILLPVLPPARELLGDRGYDSNRFRQALTHRGITPRIPSTRLRKVPIPHDRIFYRQRHRIENMLGRFKDGDAFTPATTGAPTPSRPSSSPPPSPTGCRTRVLSLARGYVEMTNALLPWASSPATSGRPRRFTCLTGLNIAGGSRYRRASAPVMPGNF